MFLCRCKDLASGGSDEKVTVISIDTWEVFKVIGIEGAVNSLCFSASESDRENERDRKSRYLASRGSDGKGTVISTDTWEVFKEIEIEGAVNHYVLMQMVST